MKFLPGIMFVFLASCSAYAQNGYIKTNRADSANYGYIKHYRSPINGQEGFELWKTKKDKSPMRYVKSSIYEYAIKKKTFRVLQNFTPFLDSHTHFELVEVELLTKGRLNLFIIRNYLNPNSVSTYTGGGLIPAIIDLNMENYSYIYLIEDNATGYIRALPSKRDKLDEILITIFPQDFLNNFNISGKSIAYGSIPSMVQKFNQNSE